MKEKFLKHHQCWSLVRHEVGNLKMSFQLALGVFDLILEPPQFRGMKVSLSLCSSVRVTSLQCLFLN